MTDVIVQCPAFWGAQCPLSARKKRKRKNMRERERARGEERKK